MQAVVKIGTSQYLVTPGQELLVDKLAVDSGEVVFEDVLLIEDGGKVQVGQPKVPGVTITANVESQTKGDKIRVYKYKSKSRYGKTTGFRAKLTKLKINDIRVKKA